MDHPGHGLDSDELSAGADEYGHSGSDQHDHTVDGPNDLMGGGMQLRPFYFNEWAQAVDRHIAELRRQRSINEMQRRIQETLFGTPQMGDFPVSSGPTRFG